jgi:hypothetical protein
MKIISTIFLFRWVLACHFMKYSSRGSSGNKHRHFPPESALMPNVSISRLMSAVLRFIPPFDTGNSMIRFPLSASAISVSQLPRRPSRPGRCSFPGCPWLPQFFRPGWLSDSIDRKCNIQREHFRSAKKSPEQGLPILESLLAENTQADA